MKYLRIIILIGALIISNTGYSQSDIHVDSTSYKHIVGMERSEVYSKYGITSSAGAIIGWVEPSPRPIMTHSISTASIQNNILVLLFYIDPTNEESMDRPFIVVDQMILKMPNRNYRLSYLGCSMSGISYYPKGEIIAVYQYTEEVIATNIEYAWLVSFGDNKFIEVSPGSVQCEQNSGSYTSLDLRNR
jgi:hypothetical protein